MMPSDKSNSITAKVMSLISSLFSIASSRDVPFCHPLLLQCLHHGSTKVHLYSPFLSPLPWRWQFVVSWLHGRLSNCIDFRSVLHAILLLKTSYRQHWKRSVISLSPFHCDWLTMWVHTDMSEYSVFPYSGKKRYFSCSFLSIMLCNEVSIHECKAVLAYELFIN